MEIRSNRLYVTVVGNRIRNLCEYILTELTLINFLDTARLTRLGNFAAITYILSLPEDKVVSMRRQFMRRCCEESTQLVPMWVQGDWMRIFVFDRFAIKSQLFME